jgi:glycosyltransferase involved in cell wall biosynthesis
MEFSIVIITKNEEINLPRCLSSLKNLSNDILIVDSGSTDRTIEIAKKFGARVIQMEWLGYAKTKNLGNREAHHDWILSLDADEVLSAELQNSLRNWKGKDNTIFYLDRITSIGDYWVKHSGWYPDWKPRLFDRRHCSWDGDYVHEYLKTPQHFQSIKISGKLRHYSYSDDLDHLNRIDKYTELSAKKMYDLGKRSNHFRAIISGISRFLRTYFIKKGILDGSIGLKIAYRNAFMAYRKHVRLVQMHKTL